MPRKHHDLVAWQKAIPLVKRVYRASQSFPRSEIFDLTSQMRRAAVSVPANIAEGMGRAGAKDRIQFLAIARGSLTELDTYAVIARELGYIPNTAELESAIDEVLALLTGLLNSERRKMDVK
ncbi:MAG: hypothetical protein A3G24_01780 [Betaproteobacteria bacterium RIFCSPLOWO2_12_FULL_62_13]|nr:MAG: hypothetical protein A3G24_01780 [Betaproteobacteria bacterium RIFCSPLOWO2_12_FULL_62_13]